MKVFRMINILILISFLFVSCGEKFDTNENENSEKAYITLDFSSARTVLPEFELSKLSNIVLKGSRNGASQETLASFDSVSSINNVGIDVGNWDFTFTAKQGNTSFSGTQSKKIEPGENSLSFTLSVVDFGDVTDVGSVKIALEFPADAGVVCVKAGLFDISGKNQISGFEPESVEITGAKVVYEKTKVPVGQYLLKIDFYGDADGKAYINTYKEIVKVASGCTSAAERSVDTLNEVYQISLELNGGELVDGVSIPAAYTRNSEKIVLPNVSTLRKDGYVLDGIYETPDFAGERINEISPEDEKSYSLYAKWNRGVVITADEISSLDLTTQTEEIEIAVYGEVTSWDVSVLSTKIQNSVANINLNLKNTSGITSIGTSAFEGCTSLTKVEIPEGVTRIYPSAFNGCTSLTKVEIPEGVTSIGSSAFEGCTSLTSVKIPLSVTRMELRAFYKCDNIENNYYGGTASQWCNIDFSDYPSMTIPRGSNFYSKGELLEDVVLDSTVTNIPSYAFSGEKSIKTVVIPESVTNIGDSAFSGCSSLEAIEISEGVTSIGRGAFYGCSSLEAIEIPEGVTSIDWYAFNGCTSLTSVKIPQSVTSIGMEVFYNCDNMENIYYGGTASQWCNIELSDLNVFPNFYCNGELLEDVVLDPTVTNIPSYAFSGIKSIKTVVIPESVTNIGRSAFEGCTSLMSVEIPLSVTRMESMAFYNCDNIENIYYGGTASQWCNIDFSDYPSITIPRASNFYSKGELLEDVVLDSTVIKIPDDAFEGNKTIKTFFIPSSVVKIGTYVFNWTSILSSVTFEDTAGWYETSSETYDDGIEIDVSNTASNVRLLESSKYLYKR